MKIFSKDRSRLLIIVQAVLFSVLSLRLVSYIYTYGVNVLFWDEWDIVQYIVGNTSFGGIFFAVHNEHNIGFSLLLVKGIAHWTHWNTKAEMYASGLLLIVSAILVLILKHRLTRTWDYLDATTLFFTLNIFQYENIIWGFQFMFILPFFLFLCGLVIGTLPTSQKRNIVLIILAIISTRTSFQGIFLSLCVGILIGKDALIPFPTRLCYLGTLCLTFLSYFLFMPVGRGLHLRHSFLEHALFIQNMIHAITQSSTLSYCVILASLFSFLYMFRRMLEKDTTIYEITLFNLFVYPICFILSTAYGRVGVTGIEGGSASRYVTYTMLLLIGLFFTSLYHKKHIGISIPISMILLSNIYMMIANDHKNYIAGSYRLEKHGEWKQCLLEGISPKDCEAQTKYEIYPKDEYNELIQKVSTLKEKKTQLFYKE